MKKLLEYFKTHKKILIISAALILLVAIACALYSANAKPANSTLYEARTETETKLMRILSEIEGGGQAEVMVTEGESGVEGVVIVCHGANDIMTRNDVLNAVTVALKVEKSNIAIYAMNK